MNIIKVALIGNPNTGKTSLFNVLTGLNQKVGNYPGITVDKKVGYTKLTQDTKAEIIDLPGTYSLNASSLDEHVAVKVLRDEKHEHFPDVALVVTDVENLKRNLLLFTQVKDLEIPTLLVINMKDQLIKKGISLNIDELERRFNTKVLLVSARTKEGVLDVKDAILDYQNLSKEPCLKALNFDEDYFDKITKNSGLETRYKAWLLQTDPYRVSNDVDDKLVKKYQHKEAIQRYKFINEVLKENYKIDTSKSKDLRHRLDRILTHNVFGYIIFFSLLFIIFQALFTWSSVPADLIDEGFAKLSSWTKKTLPSGVFTDLLSEGIISGIGGILVFVPQIAFLFLFISLLEESGYMSRVVYLMDRFMRKFGLSGKSVVPLISGTACAIPAIMATRNIESWKERLITILVTPFTTCSARLPVYAIIIALVIPNKSVLGGLMNLQGLVLMLLYLLGFVSAISAAYVLNKVLKIKHKTYFVIEMPNYKTPLLKNVALTVYEKTKAFVVGAGKIILAISIILWVLGSYGPGPEFKNAETIVSNQYKDLDEEQLEKKVAAYQLEHSYIGIIGKTIEPVIKPLGYDWKVGIALVTSFAAREVFVATLATIYSVGNDDEETIKERMSNEYFSGTNTKVYSLASGISLLLFYVFAMQCMSTLAIVKKETNGWKWPSIQFIGMTVIAYCCALIAYQFLK